jgi:hypothetical protein
MAEPPLRRETLVARLRDRLLQFDYPRVRMLWIVALTGVAGLLASFVLLHLGFASMPLRYAIALLVAYAVFLLLLRLWLIEPAHTNPDLPDVAARKVRQQDDGDVPPDNTAGPFANDSSNLFDGLASSEEFALPLLAVIALLVAVLASLWIVFSAPTLFAELAIDCALSASLYHRLRVLERRHWLDTALRHTIWPFAVTAVAVIAFAFVAQHYRPHAHSIGDVFARQKSGYR